MIDPEHLLILGTNLLTAAALFMKMGAFKQKLDTMWKWFEHHVIGRERTIEQ